MGQTLRVGSAQAHTNIISALTALGDIAGTGENIILVDAGYSTTEDLVLGSYISNSGSGDFIRISGDSGRFTLTPSVDSIELDATDCILENVDIVTGIANQTAVRLTGTNVLLRHYSITRNANGYCISGTGGSGTIEDGIHYGDISYQARTLPTARRITCGPSDYGLHVTTAEDCLVFDTSFSDDINATTVTNCATSDTSGTSPYQNIVPATELVDPTNNDYTLKADSQLIGKGVTGFSIGGDQTTGYTAPATLSSLTINSITQTTATANLDTDFGDGSLYWVLVTDGSSPSVDQIKAGTNEDDTVAALSGSQAVGGVGAQIVSLTGLTLYTDYVIFIVHARTAVSNSNILTAAFQSADTPRPVISSLSGSVVEGESLLITCTAAGTSSGKVTIGGVQQRVTSWSPTSITINIAAGDQAFGVKDLLVEDAGGIISRPYSVELKPGATFTYTDLTNPGSGPEHLFQGAFPAVKTGDQVIFEKVTNLSHGVYVGEDGIFYLMGAGGVGTTQTFKIKVFFNDLSRWSNEATVTVNEVVAQVVFDNNLQHEPVAVEGYDFELTLDGVQVS